MSAQPAPDAVHDTGVLVEQSTAYRAAIVAAAAQQIHELIDNFQSWYDDLAVRRLAKAISEVVRSHQGTAAAYEAGYMQEVMRTIAGMDRSVAATQIPRYGLRKGIDPVDEWVRLGVQYRYERSVGAPHENAIKKVLDRADVMSQYDINLANRIQWFESMLHSPLAVGYRRVVRPYLSDGGTCGMCLVAADRVYSRHTLLPIHARCKCTVVPVLRTGEDIGSSLNNLDLGDLYEQAGGQQAESLKRTRYKIVDHGELGPQLAPVKTPKGPYAGRYKPTRSH